MVPPESSGKPRRDFRASTRGRHALRACYLERIKRRPRAMAWSRTLASWVERSRGKRRLRWVLVVLALALGGSQVALRLAKWQSADAACIRVSLDEACKVSQRPGEREVEIASDHGEGCRLRHAGPWARVLIKYTNFFDALVNGDSGKEVWARRECIHDPAP